MVVGLYGVLVVYLVSEWTWTNKGSGHESVSVPGGCLVVILQKEHSITNGDDLTFDRLVGFRIHEPSIVANQVPREIGDGTPSDEC